MAKTKASARTTAKQGTSKKSRRGKSKKRSKVRIPSREEWKKSQPFAEKALKERLGKNYKSSDEYKAMQAYYKYGWGILKKLQPRGVVGVSYGPRFKDDQPKDEQTLRVHMETKTAKQRLKSKAKNKAKGWELRKTYGGVDTDIVIWPFTGSANSADGDGQVYSNGTKIKRGNEFATLGTKVVVFLDDGRQKGMWITAAHLVAAAKEDIQNPVAIVLDGDGSIGTVSKEDYYRGPLFDFALIDPDDKAFSFLRSPRGIVPLSDADTGIKLIKKGAATQLTDGTIKLLHYNGTIDSHPHSFEQVVEHFLVEGINGKMFADQGDSGACVVKSSDGAFVGIVRATTPSGIGVISRLNVIVSEARRLVL